MKVLKVIKERRSVRSFQRKEIPKEILEDLVDCGRLAPTAINIQPWEFIVVREREMLRKVADITDYGKFIAEASACVIVVCKDTKYYLQDGSAATENILLAAEDYGVGSCWVAGDKKRYAAEILELVGVPPGYRLVSLIALGYPKSKPKPEKRSLKEVIHWEKF